MLTWNGTDTREYFTVNAIRGRGLKERTLTYVSVPGMPGAHLQRVNKPIKILEVDITIKAENLPSLREKIDTINALMLSEETVPFSFSDEQQFTYYGIMSAVDESLESDRIHQTTVQITCLDPYKYGPEKTFTMQDFLTVTNTGTEESDPVFELEVQEPVTFAMIASGDTNQDYNMVGRPADDDVEIVDTKSSVLYENGSTIGTWSHTQSTAMINNDRNIHDMQGTMGTDVAGIRATNYGPNTSTGQRAAVVYKELPTAIQDFEVESTFDIISRREIENFRIMIYFNDENMNPLGQIGLKDNSRNFKRRRPIAMVGEHNEVGIMGDSGFTVDNARETTLFYVRVKREGTKFTFYVGEWMNHRHINTWHETYTDVSNSYSGKLRYITLAVSSFKDRVTPSRLRFNSVEVFELSTVTEDQTPYIAYPGDVITFDHELEEVLLNGEHFMREHDFGSSFFKLPRGQTTLTTLPENAFFSTIRYKERHK